MNKRVLLSVLIIIVGILICGCENNNTHSKKTIEKILHDNYYGFGWGDSNEKRIKCDEIKDAVSLSNHYFITKDGELYRFYGQQLLSNDKNCMDTNINIGKNSFIYNNLIYDRNKELRYIINKNELVTPGEYKEKTGYQIYEYFDLKTIDFDFISLNDNMPAETLFIKDNIVYLLNIDDGSKVELAKIPSDEKILYLSGALLKTDKSIWDVQLTNREECEKYVDIKCKIEFVKSGLTEIYDDIVFASQDLIIDRNNLAYGKGYHISFRDNDY